MNCLPKDVLLYIDTYFTANDSIQFSQVNKYINKQVYKGYDFKQKIKEERAKIIIRRFVTKYILKPYIIRKFFIKRCVEDKKYKHSKIYIHNVPRPHICIHYKSHFFEKLNFNGVEKYFQTHYPDIAKNLSTQREWFSWATH